MKELIILIILILAVFIMSMYMGGPQEKMRAIKPKRSVKFSNITDVRMFDKETGDVLFDTIKDID